MNHFPVFLALEGRRVLVAGGGDAAIAKLRLLLKTTARLTVVAEDPAPEIQSWAAEGRLALIPRAQEPGDALCCVIAYAAHEDAAKDAVSLRLSAADGALVNVVDDLANSQFITPAIVDRDPVTIAIGTEGAAPVLARKIKAELEERLPARLGLLARVGKGFRKMAEALPMGAARRRFWAAYYDHAGPRAADQGEEAVGEALASLLAEHLQADERPGHVDLVGAGPGDPELLTLKARKALHEADVVIHDRLVPPAILELARREATIIEAGKTGFGPSMAQADIDALIVEHGLNGAHVVRLKGGDPAVFGRLDEEIEALDRAGLSWAVIPGITAASASVAAIGQSLTKRGRNGAVRFLTGHDVKGFADQDWRALARPGEVAAIYMGKRAARWMQGRLMMHGAAPETPVTVVENASRPEQRIVAATLATLPDALNGVDGPALLLHGLAPRAAQAALADREIAL
ncbi:siroheme synthase CysG [Jannaschia seohaensis]|uniref:Uroporphyrin-III C-methyltransferase / precorrin-2 dehydrogenase / sirohydrochlorin ferrochelatase n=1 Tax=Jannaschia seohaensis TaxID=475081 RepID=A0A2Y9B4R6_9RHOB|nr:siroheme synthase CysG [Jannaschia seohaensis]PWJ10913.1 uroporphyrin-III C-methyltransferase/precorrin-2 dehydrogenase/sirohydrochlorin ferrochelatase [Jannaschia seohaensis]SSA51514.1 uroporphyrin-III C-methyltransferase / precorrin-2 dehydrogenase / sirohydrochlorin ferrochelatase [Jannaschia seohaensis]